MSENKTQLSQQSLSVIRIEYSGSLEGELALDDYIQKCYWLDKPFGITGPLNGSYLLAEAERIDTDDPNCQYVQEDLDKATSLIQQGHCGDEYINILLSKMVTDGFLEPGRYLIWMHW